MRKVLIVDDEPGICHVLKKGLESTGEYDVSVCTDSREALQAIKTQRPDIILLDVNMPGLSGPQLVRQLTDDETTQNIPCIYMTGNLGSGEAQGQDATTPSIEKPFKRPELIALIDKILTRSTQAE